MCNKRWVNREKIMKGLITRQNLVTIWCANDDCESELVDAVGTEKRVYCSEQCAMSHGWEAAEYD